MTDAPGRTADFRNVVVLMTSNIGSQDIFDSGAVTDWAEVEESVRGQLHNHFRTEFLNRLDDIVVFRPLSQEEIRQIVDIQLNRIAALASDFGIILDVTDDAPGFSAREGYGRVFGARPLKRAIQPVLQDPRALLLLDEEVALGTSVRVTPTSEGEKVAFEILPTASLAPMYLSPASRIAEV